MATDKPYRITVFGKAGCDKCKTLNRRLEKMLTEDSWQDFDKQYCDVETEEGLIAFCRAECVNPARIPAFLVARRSGEGDYAVLESRRPGETDTLCAASRLYQYVGLQTDYSVSGNGVISPAMIKSVLEQARAS